MREWSGRRDGAQRAGTAHVPIVARYSEKMPVPDEYRARSSRSLPVRKVAPVLAAALAIIVVWAAIDVFLTRIAAARRSANAHWSYSQGEELMHAGRFSNAVDRFRSAYNRIPAIPRTSSP